MTMEETFAQVSERLLAEDDRLTLGRMFSSAGLSIGGKFFAFARRGELVVKLPAARVDELVDLCAGVAFESGGRVMREWVAFRSVGEAACSGYVSEARDFVAAIQGMVVDRTAVRS